ncbi:Cleavage and polyadenylation specificity factor subunit 4, partial [Bonamia ostreae]
MLFEKKEVEDIKLDIDSFVNILVKHRALLHEHARQQLCMDYQKGSCPNGPLCNLRHARWKRDTLCKHWLRGLCKKTEFDCEFLHEYDLNKMAPCQFFEMYGECHNPDCLFLHQENFKECTWFVRGLCKHGPLCRRKHVKRRHCPDYLAGFCPKG